MKKKTGLVMPCVKNEVGAVYLLTQDESQAKVLIKGKFLGVFFVCF